MTNLVLIHTDGFRVPYALDSIAHILTGKAKEFHNKKDCDGNGIKLNDSVIIIVFKNGEQSTFSSVWAMIYE